MWALVGTIVACEQGEPSILAVAFSPNGRTLATGGTDGKVRLWSLPGGALQATFGGHPSPVIYAAFSPDGQLLASGDADGTTRLVSVSQRHKLLLRPGFDYVTTPVPLAPDWSLLATPRGGSVPAFDPRHRGREPSVAPWPGPLGR